MCAAPTCSMKNITTSAFSAIAIGDLDHVTGGCGGGGKGKCGGGDCDGGSASASSTSTVNNISITPPAEPPPLPPERPRRTSVAISYSGGTTA